MRAWDNDLQYPHHFSNQISRNWWFGPQLSLRESCDLFAWEHGTMRDGELDNGAVIKVQEGLFHVLLSSDADIQECKLISYIFDWNECPGCPGGQIAREFLRVNMSSSNGCSHYFHVVGWKSNFWIKFVERECTTFLAISNLRTIQTSIAYTDRNLYY